MPNFREGQAVIVADRDNFYSGEPATIKSLSNWQVDGKTLVIAYVEIPRRNGSIVGCNVATDKLEPLPLAGSLGRHRINEAC